MQRKNNGSKTRRDRGLELERPAAEEARSGRPARMESVSGSRVAGKVAPGRAIEPPPAPGPMAARPSTTVAIRRTLASRGSLRRALLLNEILGPPVALRDCSQ